VIGLALGGEGAIVETVKTGEEEVVFEETLAATLEDCT